MKLILALCFLIFHTISFSQNHAYTTNNAHSHNDYEQNEPFWAAYREGFGSIEADIFLLNDSLYVAHDRTELLNKKTLIKYYLDPIESCIKKNNGSIYSDTSKRLQILIDVKTSAVNTLKALIETLQKYPLLMNSKTISWVISGNRPDEQLFVTYPSFIFFDGDVSKEYTSQALTKIKMLSANFKNYSLWNGENIMPDSAHSSLQTAIGKVHGLNKPVRFWGAPDNAKAWTTFMRLGVDYINTDKITELSGFLKKN